MSNAPKLSCICAPTPDAQAARAEVERLYGLHPVESSDVILVLGGDGTMLEALHRTIDLDLPVYGMNRGSVGFLLNSWRTEDLMDRLTHAEGVAIYPLRMNALTREGEAREALAFNEISLFRESRYAAKIGISVDGIERLPELICDGILVSTPAGSTAYNLSAHGPILPLSANVLAMTPISAFRPRRWRGALIPSSAHIRFEILDALRRPVSATADFTEVRGVVQVDLSPCLDRSRTLLFDSGESLEERILKEQFES